MSDLVKTLRKAPFALLALVLSLAIVGSSCSSANPVALQVGEWQLSTSDFQTQLNGWADAYGAMNGVTEAAKLRGTTEGTWTTEYTSFILNQYATWHVAQIVAADRGLDITQADLDQADKRLEAAWTKDDGTSLYDQVPQAYRDIAVPGIAAETLLAPTLLQDATSDEALREVYEASKAQYAGDLVCVSHILVFAGQPDGTTAPSDAAYATALTTIQQIRAQITDPSDFAAVASQTSEDSNSAKEGGDLGCIARGSYPADFEDAAWSAPIGEVTGPVKTLYGYHLVLVDARGTLTFESLKPRLAATVAKNSASVIQARVARLASDVTITVDGRFGAVEPSANGIITTPAGAQKPATTATSAVDPLVGVTNQ